MTDAEKRALRAVAEAVLGLWTIVTPDYSPAKANIVVSLMNAMHAAVAAVEHEDGSR